MVDFGNQVNTVMANPNERKRVQNKTVLLVDDFETQGWSAECARNLLLQAGARDVICVCIGKYPKPRHVLTSNDMTWDPYVPQQHPAGRFADAISLGSVNPLALTLLRESYQRVGARS